MAFNKGKEVAETSFKKFIGVANCKVKGLNLSKKEMEDMFGTSLEAEPKYVSSIEIDGKEYPSIRLEFIISPTDIEDAGNFRMSLFLQKRYKYNRDKTKVQVIDKYGRTAWVTIEQAKNHEIPVYSNGPANLDKNYRPAYVGEPELIDFLKAYLCIPNVMKYVNNQWVIVDNPQECEATFENIDKLFTGDVSEIKEALALAPEYKIGILFGVKTTDDNRLFPAFFTSMFIKGGSKYYDKLKKEVEARQAAGAYPNVEFEVGALKEYVVKATDFKSNVQVDNPFSSSVGSEDDLPW